MRIFQGAGIIFMLLFIVLLEYYAFTAFRFAIRSVRPSFKLPLTITFFVVIAAWFMVLLAFPTLRTADMNRSLKNVLVSFTMALFIMKLVIAVFYLFDDIRRGLFYLSGKFYTPETIPATIANGMSRSDFLAKSGLFISTLLFGSLWYGMTNRYRYTVKRVPIKFPNLPPAFKGLRMVQISDIHSGSFNNKEAVAKGVQRILDLKPDLIVFTGDIVNNISKELKPYAPIFAKLAAPLGVYSILGNHDYGDYYGWASAEAKSKNLQKLKDLQAQMGWRLLLNEHVQLERDGDKIALIGVENTSFKNRFKSYGDLSKAYAGSQNIPFKILLSHDPSHWDGEVNKQHTDIDLTLSGHTHGFQFGVEIPGFKWSPAQYVYKQWAGLYQEGQQYLYVNRGFGFLGYPGRVGMLPEITLFEFI
ncbi:MAG: metallophosphoesterase [Chitinophagaceae bacterium]|nr:metallophosphoesterase [Chitinophagaceae bacterium]